MKKTLFFIKKIFAEESNKSTLGYHCLGMLILLAILVTLCCLEGPKSTEILMILGMMIWYLHGSLKNTYIPAYKIALEKMDYQEEWLKYDLKTNIEHEKEKLISHVTVKREQKKSLL